MRSFLAVAFFTAILLMSCSSTEALDPNLGGATTREDASRNSFGLPAPGLTNEQRRFFERGDSFFTQNWVTAPASTDARDGLGPLLNAASCSSCHVLDGRGAPPDPTGQQANLGLLMRISVPGEDPLTGASLPDPNYGGQIQDRSIQGVAAEALIDTQWLTVAGVYADGTGWELRSPSYELSNLAYGPVDTDLLMSPRLAPQVFGMGLLEAIPEATLRDLADPDDADSDGISGRLNFVWDQRLDESVIGRFGWKANVATVEQQVAGAFHGDIGITSSLHPAENCSAAQVACSDAITGGHPELTDERLEAVTFYNSTLAVPAMRDVESDQVQSGAKLFDSIGCAGCHTQTLQTGSSSIGVLANQTIHPYTDLLLHDMGAGLADGRPDFEATETEWRTPPLWGLGLIDDVNGQRFLLHDGRARTIDEAILWHGGEGQASNDQFQALSAQDRAALIAFLEAL